MATLTITFTPVSPAPANGYEVKYRIKGTNDAYQTVSPNPTGSPVVISGLLPSTEYEGTIRSNCGSGFFSDIGTFSTCTCPAGYVKAEDGDWCEDTDTVAPTITQNNWCFAPSKQDVYTQYFARIYAPGFSSASIDLMSPPSGQVVNQMSTPGLWANTTVSWTFQPEAIDTDTDTITIPSHNMVDGEVLVYMQSTAAPSGLEYGMNLKVAVVDPNTIQLIKTSDNIPFDFQDDGDGTHSLYRYTSAMNTDAIWVDSDCDGIKDNMTVGAQVTIAGMHNNTGPERTIHIGVGADNQFRLNVNGVQIAQTPVSNSDRNFKIWHIFPVTLLQGWNYFNAIATGDGTVNDAIAMVVYDNDAADLSSAVTEGDLTILFRTKDLIGESTDIATCPNGYNLDTSGGQGNYVCVRNVRVDCGGA